MLARIQDWERNLCFPFSFIRRHETLNSAGDSNFNDI